MNKSVFLGSVGLAAAIAAAQPLQWRVEDGGNGHWYAHVATAATNNVAQASCLALGGHLASISNSQENQHVLALLQGSPSWIGGKQQAGSCEPGCGWGWLDGTVWQYTNWDQGEPNDGGGGQPGESGIEFLTTGKWNDYWPWQPRPAYVIEWDADCNNDGIVDYGQILSGEFLDANHNGIPDGFAVLTQPVDQNIGVDVPVVFAAEVALPPNCTTPAQFQWQRRDPSVLDDAAPNAWIDLSDGGGLINTRTASLTILRPIPALATGYRCRINGGCGCEPAAGGFVYTNTVNFSVACPADFNADGGIDGQDIQAFFERWENGC